MESVNNESVVASWKDVILTANDIPKNAAQAVNASNLPISSEGDFESKPSWKRAGIPETNKIPRPPAAVAAVFIVYKSQYYTQSWREFWN